MRHVEGGAALNRRLRCAASFSFMAIFFSCGFLYQKPPSSMFFREGPCLPGFQRNACFRHENSGNFLVGSYSVKQAGEFAMEGFIRSRLAVLRW